jgi:hypothetical protein
MATGPSGVQTSGDSGARGEGGGSPSSGSASGSPGSAACGCNGASGCAVWTDVFVTFYGFNDNSCTLENEHSCDDIAYPGLGPKMHQVATESAGTFDDPITCAASDQGSESSGGATLSPGTIVYNPEVKKYFIMEDSCLECGDEWTCHLSADDTDDPAPPANCQPDTNLHIDFWMGPSFMQSAAFLNACEDNSTLGGPYAGKGTVLVNPPGDLPVAPALLYSGMGAGGGCWTQAQAADPCP